MPKYRNTANHTIIIPGQIRLETIMPGQIVELPSGIARRGLPYLVQVQEAPVVDTRQILIEAPQPLEVVKEEPKVEEAKVEEPVEETVTKIDVDGDGTPDVEIKKTSKRKKKKKENADESTSQE